MTPQPDIQLLAATQQRTRCPYCHDGVEEAGGWICPSCAAVHHVECRQELPSCGACQTVEGDQATGAPNDETPVRGLGWLCEQGTRGLLFVSVISTPHFATSSLEAFGIYLLLVGPLILVANVLALQALSGPHRPTAVRSLLYSNLWIVWLAVLLMVR